ncbi:hypothetical protein QJQ45_001284 [Haematococcus lacustris]|nr:hypothetical protein QJQ45_001284 [Haematococcus lacustris]
MYNKRMQYSASAAQYLAALLDPRYRRQSQHVTREQKKLAEQLLIKLATEDGSEGDRPAAEALSQLALWQQPDVVLFSRTSLSAVYFAPQLTTDPVRWWRLHGDSAPELQTVAQRVLCIPATAAANERVFSAFSHVWSDKRASLILGRMWIMAYIYFNKLGGVREVDAQDPARPELGLRGVGRHVVRVLEGIWRNTHVAGSAEQFLKVDVEYVKATSRAEAGCGPSGSSPAADPSGSSPAADPSGSSPAADPSGSSPTADHSGSSPAADPSGSSPAADPSGSSPAAGPSGSSPAAEDRSGSSSNKRQPADIGSGLADERAFLFDPATQVGGNVKLEQQHLAGATPAGTSLVAIQRHVAVTLATWDAVWGEYLHPKWAEQKMRLHGAQEKVLERYFKKLEEEAASVSLQLWGARKQLVVFFGNAGIGTRGGWGAKAVLQACRKVVERPNSGKPTDRVPGEVVTVDGFRTNRVSSIMNSPQPCEEELDSSSPPGLRTGSPSRATPGDLGKWVESDCNAALHLQRAGESKWRPLELCSWPHQGRLPAKGKEYPAMVFKKLRDRAP